MELPWAKKLPGSRQGLAQMASWEEVMCCTAPCCATGWVVLGWWVSAEGRACSLWRRGEGLDLLSSILPWKRQEAYWGHKITLIKKTPQIPTWDKTKIRLALGIFQATGPHLVCANFLKSLLFPRSQEAVERVSGSWHATFLTPFHNVCTSVKGLPQTKHKGCTALASKYRVVFLSFFFS